MSGQSGMEAIIAQFFEENISADITNETNPMEWMELKNGLVSLAEKNKLDISNFSSKSKIVDILNSTNYSLKEVKTSKGKQWKLKKEVFTENVMNNIETSDIDIVSAKLDLNLSINKNSTDDEVYASFGLFIMSLDSWKKYTYGKDPKHFVYYTSQYLCFDSIFGQTVRHTLVPDTRKDEIKNLQISDPFYKFTYKNDFLKKFIINKFTFGNFEKIMQKIFDVLEPLHPQWLRDYEIVSEKNRIARAEAAERARIEKIKMEEILEKERLEREKIRKMEEDKCHKAEARKNRIIRILTNHCYPIDIDPTKENPYVALLDKYLPEIHLFDRAIKHPIEKLTKNKLKCVIDFACRKYDIKLHTHWTYDINYENKCVQYVRNFLIVNGLKTAIKQFVGSGDIIENYKKYFDLHILDYYEEFEEDFDTYDVFSNYKFVCNKLTELFLKLLEIKPDDMHLLKAYKLLECTEKNQNKIQHLISYFAAEDYVCTDLSMHGHNKNIGEYFEENRRIRALNEHSGEMMEYKPYCTRYCELCSSDNEKMIDAMLYNEDRNMRKEIEKYKKEKDRIANDKKFGTEHEGWMCRFRGDEGYIYRTMHYDDTDNTMYYYPDDNDTTIESEHYTIAYLQEQKWQAPGIRKCEKSSAQQFGEMFEFFMKMRMMCGGMPNMEKMKMLMRPEGPAVDENSDEECYINHEENDDEDEKDKLIRQLREKLDNEKEKNKELKNNNNNNNNN